MAYNYDAGYGWTALGSGLKGLSEGMRLGIEQESRQADRTADAYKTAAELKARERLYKMAGNRQVLDDLDRDIKDNLARDKFLQLVAPEFTTLSRKLGHVASIAEMVDAYPKHQVLKELGKAFISQPEAAQAPASTLWDKIKGLASGVTGTFMPTANAAPTPPSSTAAMEPGTDLNAPAPSPGPVNAPRPEFAQPEGVRSLRARWAKRGAPATNVAIPGTPALQ